MLFIQVNTVSSQSNGKKQVWEISYGCSQWKLQPNKFKKNVKDDWKFKPRLLENTAFITITRKAWGEKVDFEVTKKSKIIYCSVIFYKIKVVGKIEIHILGIRSTFWFVCMWLWVFIYFALFYWSRKNNAINKQSVNIERKSMP